MPLPRPFLLLALALLPHSATLAADATVNAERTSLGHVIAFGRPAAIAAASPDSLATQLERHRAELQHHATARERNARAAWFDAFGRAPSTAELQAEAALPLIYTERMERHLARLRAEPAEYRAVLHRAYRLVVHREAYAEEFDYWRPHGVHSFVVLVACIEDWARRNRPGLMVTAGIPSVPARSRLVTIIPVTPALAAEATTIPANDSPARDPATRVLAAGAGGIRTAGGMHLAIVGRD